MSYELFLNGSTAEIIITILVSLIVTLAVYCAFPLLIASFRKTPITKRKYRHICFAANIIPLLIFIVINGSSSGGPYLIWTTVFAGSGSKKLATRGLLIDGRNTKQQTSQQTEVTKMSLSPADDKNPSLGKAYGHSLVTGSDIRLEPAPVVQPTTPSQPPKKSTPVIHTPSSAPSKQRFCKYCGGAIDPETKQCTSCGKQFFKPPKASSGKLIATIVVLALMLGVGGFFLSNYNKGIEAMNNQQFILAKQYFDKLLVGESIFSDEYAYIEAGVLMETGEYIEAYKSFSALENTPVPISIINKLKEQIYSFGVKAYDSGDLSTAKKYLSVIEDYNRSSDFLLLISCKGSSLKAEQSYNRLFEIIDFKDTKEVILNNSYILGKFLWGRWEDGNTHPYYFEIDEEETAYYNLPGHNLDGYYFLNDGCYSVGESASSATKLFKFSIINADTISVYCYKDGSTHRLHCVKRYELPTQTTNPEKSLFYSPDYLKVYCSSNMLFHRQDCPNLGENYLSLTIDVAKSNGYAPCPDCWGIFS